MEHEMLRPNESIKRRNVNLRKALGKLTRLLITSK